MPKKIFHSSVHLPDSLWRIALQRMATHRSFNAYICHCIEIESRVGNEDADGAHANTMRPPPNTGNGEYTRIEPERR